MWRGNKFVELSLGNRCVLATPLILQKKEMKLKIKSLENNVSPISGIAFKRFIPLSMSVCIV